MFSQYEISKIMKAADQSCRRDGMAKVLPADLRQKFESFVRKLPKNVRRGQLLHQVQINSTELPRCHCGNPTVWAPSENSYSEYCSTTCRNKHKSAALEGAYSIKRHVAVSQKDIEAFTAYYEQLGAKKHTIREYHILEGLTKRLRLLWVSLPGKTISKVMILTGVIEQQAYCACGNKVNGFHNDGTWREYCSKKCHMLDPRTKKQRKRTFMERYGVENSMQVPGAMDKRRRTLIKKYGVDHPARIDTFAETKQATMQRRYGVDHAFQMKSFCQNKTITLNGKRQTVQGFEPQAVEYIKRFVNEREITLASSGKVPHVAYRMHGKERTYYPDILLKGTNTLVEVKSSFTFCGRKDWFYTLKVKRAACLDAGYKFRLLVIGENGNRVAVPKNWHSLSHKQITCAMK